MRANRGWHDPTEVGVAAMGMDEKSAASKASRCLQKLEKEGTVQCSREGLYKAKEGK
jgi:hypothetical protein